MLFLAIANTVTAGDNLYHQTNLPIYKAIGGGNLLAKTIGL